MEVPEHLDAETIYALLDERLDAVRARQVESHLWRCERCRRLREECGALRNALAWYAADPPAAPEGYWEEFWRRYPLASLTTPQPANPEPAAGRASVRRFRPAMVAPALGLAAAVVLIIGFWRIDGQPADEPPALVFSPAVVQADWADDYEFFQQVTVAVGSVDPMSKGVVLASLAQAP